MATTHYLWNPLTDNVLAETDETGATIAEYTHEPGQYGKLISQRRNGATSYYHYDGQGSTRALTDDSGNVTDTSTYTAFGETVEKTGSTTNSFGYKGAAGYYLNPETDDLYVRARMYMPEIARWMSVDPIGFVDGPNQYTYVSANPIGFVDASGLKPQSPACLRFCGNWCRKRPGRCGGHIGHMRWQSCMSRCEALGGDPSRLTCPKWASTDEFGLPRAVWKCRNCALTGVTSFGEMISSRNGYWEAGWWFVGTWKGTYEFDHKVDCCCDRAVRAHLRVDFKVRFTLRAATRRGRFAAYILPWWWNASRVVHRLVRTHVKADEIIRRVHHVANNKLTPQALCLTKGLDETVRVSTSITKPHYGPSSRRATVITLPDIPFGPEI